MSDQTYEGESSHEVDMKAVMLAVQAAVPKDSRYIVIVFQEQSYDITTNVPNKHDVPLILREVTKTLEAD